MFGNICIVLIFSHLNEMPRQKDIVSYVDAIIFTPISPLTLATSYSQKILRHFLPLIHRKLNTPLLTE